MVEAKDAQIAGLPAALEAAQARQAELVKRLELRVAELERVHWLLPRLRCGGCGTVTAADPPDGRAGTVV